MAIGSPQWMYKSGEAYEIDQSLKLDSASVANLQFTPSSASNRKTWTLSFWCKVGDIASGEQSIFTAGTSCTDRLGVMLDGSNHLSFNVCGVGDVIETQAVYRDPSAWLHCVFVLDTTQSTSTDRGKIYVNGEAVALTHNSSLTLNKDYTINNNTLHAIGALSNAVTSASYTFGGYLGEMHFIDGQTLTPADFGETGDYGEWKPIEYSGSYGTNGFYLDFADSSDLGNDVSGNNNDWTVVNLVASDQMVDSPTNNFATLNPLWQDSSITLQEGNLRSSRNANMNRPSQSTISLGTGKWYFEALDQYTTGNQIGVEWEGADVETHVHTSGIKAYTWNSSGSTYAEGTYESGNNGGSVASGARIRMVAYDGATGKLWGGANGTWGSSGNPAAGTNESMTVPAAYRDKMHFVVATENSSTSQGIVANFGQDSSFAGLKTAQGNQDGNGIGDFYYTPPTGFLALCTKNLPDVAVVPSEHFNTVLYTGDGNASRTISGAGFAPDLLWGKIRSTTNNHFWFDTLRGANRLISNGAGAETDYSTWFSTLTSDGFTTGTTNANSMNQLNATFVAWFWKANGSGSSNTDGTITSTVSANVDAGFSIVTYTGTGSTATVGHGLSKAPDMMIIKTRGVADNWLVGANAGSMDYTDGFYLDSTLAKLDSDTFFNDTTPTSSVFTVKSHSTCNTNNGTYVAYCFHSVDGYSKVGSYTGNGNADGSFVYTGFRPAFVMVKDTTATHHWWVWDTARNTYNEMDEALVPNLSVATQAPLPVDSLSNGFKFRTSNTQMNTSGNTYIYLAFAETPFKYSNAR